MKAILAHGTTLLNMRFFMVQNMTPSDLKKYIKGSRFVI